MDEDQRISELLRKVDLKNSRPAVQFDWERCGRLVKRRQSAHQVAARLLVASTVMLGVLVVAGRTGLLFDRDDGLSARRQNTHRDVREPTATAPVSPTSESQRRDIDLADTGPSSTAAATQQQLIQDALERYESRRRLERLEARVAELQTQQGALDRVRLQEQIYCTAGLRLNYADYLAHHASDATLAASEYRDIVQKYPGTQWAAAAAKVLAGRP